MPVAINGTHKLVAASRRPRSISGRLLRPHAPITFELDDGSRWQFFPGDLDLTLGWKPETELSIVPTDDEISSRALIGDGGKLRVIPAGESWPIGEVKSILKDG